MAKNTSFGFVEPSMEFSQWVLSTVPEIINPSATAEQFLTL